MKSIFNASDVQAFERLIDKHDRIVLTCHMRPDGDALGSTLGLWHLLRAMGKHPSVVVPDRIPRSLAFLPGAREIAVYTQYDPYCSRLVAEAEVIVMCDFNAAYRQGQLASLIQGADCPKVLVDHHLDPEPMAGLTFSFPEMSSTCELVFRLVAACGWYGLLDKAAATCILTGLVTDTQNFTVNCNDPEVYEVLMKLLEKEADKKLIIDEAIKSTTLDALRLKSFALLERLEIFERHRCALITLSESDLKRFDYQKGDTEGLVNEALQVKGVVWSVFMRQDPDCIKVSTRSKFDFPVSKVCEGLFNGGGHLMAAGGEFNGTLAECRQTLLDNICRYDSFLPRKLDKLEVKPMPPLPGTPGAKES